MSMLPPVKRGETMVVELVWTRAVRDAGGRPVIGADGQPQTAPVDLTGRTVTAGVRNGAFTGALTTTVLDAAAGLYRIEATATATGTWPVTDGRNRMFVDAKAVLGALVDFAPTLEIPVEEGITP